ncbi:hypothetical protein KY285_024339 [Solanum tuberosum]|nr:hypothetical protein KY285_024339 [Solanum tuberosum]
MEERILCFRIGDGSQEIVLYPSNYSFRFNLFRARLLLEKLRNKRLMFVGDSLNRNQWESMICLLQSGVPFSWKKYKKIGHLSVFMIEEYNATVEFYWAPYLVESNSDDPAVHSILTRLIMPESIEKHGNNWKNVDYLIFNTYVWWMNGGTMKVLRGSFDEGSTEYDEVDRTIAYTRVLTTWSQWVQNNVDPKRTRVFFMSMSPMHIKSMDWNNPNGIKCAKETTPVLNMSMPLNVGTDKRLFAIASNVTKSMKFPVCFMNITRISEYRKDAHTSLYTIRQGKKLTPEQQADPAMYADCIHWCLPGLPDTWNELLYTHIMSTSIDYGAALTKSLLYFEAQRSGKLPSNQRVQWRGDSALEDGKDDGIGLTGGYYDAGDNVKFGFPMAFTITILAWSATEFESQLNSKNELKNALNAIKWGTDYFIKAHKESHVLYGEIGEGISDHKCWERPEDMTTPRSVYKIDEQHPGADLAGETAAALAAAAVAFKESDSGYSNQLLTHAKELFDFAKKFPGVYTSSIPVAGKFYGSSGYEDELLWAAVWLYKATKDKSYLDYINEKSTSCGGTRLNFSWDDKYIGAQVLIAKIHYLPLKILYNALVEMWSLHN